MQNDAIEFGPYVVDFAERRLTRAGRPIDLNPKCFEALEYLMRRDGSVVSKEELLAAVWPEGSVEPNNVPQTIYLLRRALKFAGDDEEFIETVPGRGYRFAAPMKAATKSASRATMKLPPAYLAAGMGVVLAASIVILISGVRPARPPAAHVDPSAKAAYTQGRFYWSRRTPDNLKAALNHFQTAIRLDPQYAQGYSGLADTYLAMRWASISHADSKRLGQLARGATMTGLSLDGTCAECHASLGMVSADIDYDRKAAEREYVASIKLDPNYATAHEWYSWLLFRSKPAQALNEMQRASDLDPESPIIRVALGWQLFYTRQFQRSAAAFADASTLDPTSDYAFFGLALSREETGELASGLQAISQALKLSDDPGYSAERARLLAEDHRSGEAKVALDRLRSTRPPSWYYLALVYDALHERQLAKHYLVLAVKHRDEAQYNVMYDPRLDDLRSTLTPGDLR